MKRGTFSRGSAVREELNVLLSEIGPLCGKHLRLLEDSIVVEGQYCAATALTRSDEGGSPLVQHTILAKLFIAESDHGTEKWVLLFHYLNGRLVAPVGLHYMRLVRAKAPEGVGWSNLGWEADEYGEWSELEEIDPDARALG